MDATELATQINVWMGIGTGIFGLISAILGVLFRNAKRTKDELSGVIDKSPIRNDDFKTLAEKEGLKLATKVIGKLLSK